METSTQRMSPKMKKKKSAEEKKFKKKDSNKFEKRKQIEEPQKNEVSDKQHLIKRVKKIESVAIVSRKQLHNEKKKAIQAIKETTEVLGMTKERDLKERELEEFIFGCDVEGLEDETSDSHSEEEKDEQEIKEVRKPAWVDEEDEKRLIEEKYNTLDKSISHRGNKKYSNLIRGRFKEPKWAEIERTQNSDDDSDDELLQKTGNYIKKSKSLSRGTIIIQKCPNLSDGSLRNGKIKSVEFHPSARVAAVASTNGTASLFQIDGKNNAKIQSVHFKNFPIHSAHFTLNGNEIVVGSNAYGHYFSYDMMSGKIARIHWEKGMEQRNVRRFHMSPDGKYIVIQGRYGYIHLVTTQSKEWVGSLKMNGEVIAVTFNKDGSKMFSHGDTGEIYIWDMNARKCIHKFFDEGCVTGTSLAYSPNDQFLAAGSDTGVVNVYDNNTLFESNSPKPIKVLQNLTTEVTHLKFNCTSELLAMSSSHKENAVKLVHFPSMSVFSNFPKRDEQSKLCYINSQDISVNSGYLCLGNNLSTVHIFRLKHYQNY